MCKMSLTVPLQDDAKKMDVIDNARRKEEEEDALDKSTLEFIMGYDSHINM